ncbi:energy-coupling factor transporter transmembrane component T family protein [Microbacterium sp. JB110]|uniref:energy-coupling factor transporter transmembrane component T family protein n=1 Tax=Microbacterium sp. JB110 TaxID=2024477 RepID=UPI000B357A48|nr:energy-coupling factor transporter transmembrane component T [Microbacterium sp. JB110]RCS58900.1 energy-coupling factor transporter transmembrane protein EcfT [Microbacterium sp. JB110]
MIDARHSPLAGVNALAKLVATLMLGIALMLSIDPVSAGVSLVLTLAVLPFARLGVADVWRRTWPIAAAAAVASVATVLYGRPAGQMYVEWGILRISDGSIDLALAILLRVLAIALPAVVLLSTTDPTDLADALGQIVKLPARFVLGALAGLRLVGLLISDWREMSLARRARGVADHGRLRRFLGMAFALFVLAIRRGTHLATAMEARGFGADPREVRRTWARPSVLRLRDGALVLLAAVIAAVSIAAAIATGAWTFILTL